MALKLLRQDDISEVDSDFASTLLPSFLASDLEEWTTSSQLQLSGELFAPTAFLTSTDYLLENPNQDSPNAFHGDILYDSDGVLTTPGDVTMHPAMQKTKPRTVPGFEMKRMVLRRIAPVCDKRNPSLDETLHFYQSLKHETLDGTSFVQKQILVIYTPHISSLEDIPFYYPPVQAIAFLYDFISVKKTEEGCGTISLHFLPLSSPPGASSTAPNHLQRTLMGLLSTRLRPARKHLFRNQLSTGPQNIDIYEDDAIISPHDVENTYDRLRKTYLAELLRNWVEKTEPTKHIFEHLSIAAFLIELWKRMYRTTEDDVKPAFPGFVDIACGNGVLVHVLLSEGYQGWGFDARRRKTWSILPLSTQKHLKEKILIPKPFAHVLENTQRDLKTQTDHRLYTELLDKDTFIISNHADELTVWTPLLGVLSNPRRPLPFLAIPCCSHGLSGRQYRYPPSKRSSPSSQAEEKDSQESKTTYNLGNVEYHEGHLQPAAGDLKALRALKLQERAEPRSQNSVYGCLTDQTIHVAEELGYTVETSKIPILSTRNVGIVGQIKASKLPDLEGFPSTIPDYERESSRAVKAKIEEIVKRECERDGGIEAAARMWFEGAFRLQHTGRSQEKRPVH